MSDMHTTPTDAELSEMYYDRMDSSAREGGDPHADARFAIWEHGFNACRESVMGGE